MRAPGLFGLLLAVLLGAVGPDAAAAQNTTGTPGPYDLSVRDVPVDAALEELVGLTGIDLVYSSEVVADRSTLCRQEDATAEELLRCIVAGASLDYYRLSSGTYVVIRGPEELPEYGTLSGEIVDGLSGQPLPRARVELADGSLWARSDGMGLFVLGRLLPGRHVLRVSRGGYAPVELSLEVPPSGRVRRSIRLDPSVVELDPLVVDGMEDVGGASVGRDGWRRGEGVDAVPVDGDVGRELRRGVGVARRPLFADIHIQGAGPSEQVIRLDGVPVFDPVSLGRTRSAFSPLALRRITVHKAGFGVEEGSFSGGIVDLDQAVTHPGAGSGSVLVDPYSASADLALPLQALGGEGSLMVSGRTSLWDIYRQGTLNQSLRRWNDVDPVLMRRLVGDHGEVFTDALRFDPHRHGSELGFDDLHAALQLSFPGFRTLEASFYRGTNEVSTELFAAGADPSTGTLERLLLARDAYRWSNTMGRLEGSLLLGDRASLRLGAWGSRHRLDHGYLMVDGDEVGYRPGELDVGEAEDALRAALVGASLPEDGNAVDEFGAEAVADFAAGGGHFLTAGLESVRVRNRTHLLNGFVRPLVSRAETWRTSAFLQDRWDLGGGVTWEVGLRATSVDGSQAWWEPRTALRVDGASQALGPWSVRLAGGIYRQFLNSFELTNVGASALVPEVRFWIPSDETLAPPRSRHLALEVGARPAPGWEVRVEGYHKWLDRILALDYGVLLGTHGGTPDTLSQADFVGEAEGAAYGVGARVGWEEGRARLQVGYDWSVSERTFPSRFDGQRQPAPWSEPHAVSLQGRLPMAAGLALETDARSVFGRSWGLRRAYFDFLTLHGTDGGPDIGLPGDSELPALHRVDLGLSWLGRPWGHPAEVRAELRNALGTDQVLDYSLRRATQAEVGSYRQVPRLLPGRRMALTLRVGF